MAKILDQEEQRKALRNIVDSLKKLKNTNEFLDKEPPSGIYTISFTDADGKRCSADILVQDKQTIDALVLQHKEAENARIIKLAADNRIDLDEKDYEIMNYVPGAEQPKADSDEAAE